MTIKILLNCALYANLYKKGSCTKHKTTANLPNVKINKTYKRTKIKCLLWKEGNFCEKTNHQAKGISNNNKAAKWVCPKDEVNKFTGSKNVDRSGKLKNAIKNAESANPISMNEKTSSDLENIFLEFKLLKNTKIQNEDIWKIRESKLRGMLWVEKDEINNKNKNPNHKNKSFRSRTISKLK